MAGCSNHPQRQNTLPAVGLDFRYWPPHKSWPFFAFKQRTVTRSKAVTQLIQTSNVPYVKWLRHTQTAVTPLLRDRTAWCHSEPDDLNSHLLIREVQNSSSHKHINKWIRGGVRNEQENHRSAASSLKRISFLPYLAAYLRRQKL